MIFGSNSNQNQIHFFLIFLKNKCCSHGFAKLKSVHQNSVCYLVRDEIKINHGLHTCEGYSYKYDQYGNVHELHLKTEVFHK